MRNVILAPHIDDEMIGCWSLFANGQVDTVVYFYDATPSRQHEAQVMQNWFKVPNISFEGYDFAIEPDMVLWVPNIADTHVNHKSVNHWAKHFKNPKKYYSVDMNVPFTVLSEEDQKLKQRDLIRCYSSQQKLFEDEKYWLFESIMDDDTDKMIWVKFQRKGLHHYPQALTESTLSDVKYLGHTHRHLFKFCVYIQVWHNDRDIEFHQFLNWVESLYDSSTLVLDHKSCEMLADELYLQILHKYPNRKVTIEVSEDGECGVVADYK